MSHRIAPKLLAEFIGTFAFVFIGAGAAAVVGEGVGMPGIVAIAFAHGLAIMAFAFAYGSVSGGHFNPAVTVGVLAAGAMGVGEAVADKKVMDAALADLTKITGQKPLITKSRKAIAAFKIRAGLAIGAKVTLRGRRMYEFLDRLINIAMPRIRDFRGVSPRSFDGQGNFSLGVKEQIIFPEIDYDAIDEVRGMDITITTSAPTDPEAFALLLAMGLPFSQQGRPREFDDVALDEERAA